MCSTFKLICIGFVYFFSIFNASAQVSPEIQWKVLKSGRFSLVYDAKQQELAKQYLQKFYQAEGFLKQYFDQFPDKLVIILNDRTDSTNGYATPMPYPTVALFPVLPSPQDSIGEYKDWGLELVTHEYTHILSFEPKRGVFKFLNATFGSIMTPNMLVPRWWLEGVAVEMETLVAEGKGGRLVSAYQDASLRALSEGGWLSRYQIGDIGELSYPYWPYGSLPYLYGSLLWSDLRSSQSKDFTKNLHWLQSGRLPISINQPLYDLTQTTFQERLEGTVNRIEEKLNKQKIELSVQPFTKLESIGYSATETFNPLISPDGYKMLFLAKGLASSRQLKLLVRQQLNQPFHKGNEVKVLEEKLFETQPTVSIPRNDPDAPPGGNINFYSWAPDSNSFVYDLISESSDFEDRSQIWIFNLKNGKAEKLITKERARHPVFSMDGQKIAFISMGPANNSLKIFDLKTKQIQVVSTSPYFVRYTYPCWISSDELLIVERKDGKDQLRLFNLSNGQDRLVSTNLTNIRYLKRNIDGSFLLASSSVNGVSNLYLVSRFSDFAVSKFSVLTHTYTGSFSGDIDVKAGQVYSSVLTLDGYQIQTGNPSNLSLASLPKTTALFADRYQGRSNVPSTVDYSFTEEDYSPWGYLRPYYWLPSFSLSDSTQLGFATGSQDPLGKHLWSIDFVHDFDLKESSYLAAYRNRVLNPAIDVSSLQLRTYIVNTDTKYRLTDHRVSSTWQLAEISPDLYGGVGFQSQEKSFLNLTKKSDGAFVEVRYGSLSKVGLQISPESGINTSLRYTDVNKRASGFYEQYFSGFLPDRHVLMARLQGLYTAKSVDLSEFVPVFNYSASAVAQREVFLNRGYSNSRFMMKSFGLANLEYRMPISYHYRGFGTSSFYYKRLHAAVVADAHQGRGFIYRTEQKDFLDTDQDKLYWSAGLELKADMTILYQIPFTTYVGVYAPGNKEVEDDNQVVLGFQF